MTFYDFIINPLTALIIGILLGITGIILTIISKQNKFLIFKYSTDRLISNFKSAYEGLTLKYNNDDIESFCKTKIVLWNKGKSSICSNDITEKDPLKFHVGNALIFNYCIIGMNDDSIDLDLKLSEDKKHIIIYFDHLNYNDGFIIQLFHTENENSFSVTGTLKCQKGKIENKRNLREIYYHSSCNPIFLAIDFILKKIKLNKIYNDNFENILDITIEILGIMYVIFFNMLSLLLCTGLIFNIKSIANQLNEAPSMLIKIIIIILCVVFLGLSIFGLTLILKKSIPKKLRQYL